MTVATLAPVEQEYVEALARDDVPAMTRLAKGAGVDGKVEAHRRDLKQLLALRKELAKTSAQDLENDLTDAHCALKSQQKETAAILAERSTTSKKLRAAVSQANVDLIQRS